jgi:hypothetical protein
MAPEDQRPGPTSFIIEVHARLHRLEMALARAQATIASMTGEAAIPAMASPRKALAPSPEHRPSSGDACVLCHTLRETDSRDCDKIVVRRSKKPVMCLTK